MRALRLDHLEAPKSHQGDHITLFQRVNDRLENAIHRRLRFRLAADDVRHFVDQICLVHECPLSSH